MSIRVDNGLDFSRLKSQVEQAKPEAERAGASVVLDEAKKGVGTGPPRGPGEAQNLAERATVRSVATGAEILFPGPYAVYLHERLDLAHPGGGHAKYLELAVLSEKDAALGKAAAVIREALH